MTWDELDTISKQYPKGGMFLDSLFFANNKGFPEVWFHSRDNGKTVSPGMGPEVLETYTGFLSERNG